MAATAAQILELRAMVAEPTVATYSDAALTAKIEAYPVPDAFGRNWFTWDYGTTPPSKDADADWIPTYDLHAAAERIWNEKSALLVAGFDFSADGASYSRSQGYNMARKMARLHGAQRIPGTIEQVVEPRRIGPDVYPLNAAEAND